MSNASRFRPAVRPEALQSPAHPAMPRRRVRALVAGLIALPLMAGVVLVTPTPASAFTGEGPNGTDTVTGGNWSFTYDLPLAGTVRAYNYGTFGYVLPDAPGQAEYELGGANTTNPSLDETGGPGFGDAGYAGEKARYAVHGPATPDNRSVLSPDGTQRRQAACYGGSVAVSLPLAAGDYRIAVYAVDYDQAGRIQTQLAASNSTVAQETVSSFSQGVYALYTVHSDGVTPVQLSTAAVGGPNAVISGVFVDAASSSVVGSNAAGFDTTTQGNWVGHYGSKGYLLCGFNAPGVNASSAWSPSMDVASGLGAYSVAANVWSWTGLFPAGGITQPVYSWAWNGFSDQLGTDTASTTFWKFNSTINGPSVLGQRRATAWDSGDDVNGNTPRTMSVDLHVPANSATTNDGFQVAFYFRDADANRSEQFVLKDKTRNLTLDTQTVSAFGGGIYYRYLVPAGTDLTLDVTRTAGVNAVLSGIFLDELNAQVNGGGTGTGSGGVTDTPYTPGYWGNWSNHYTQTQFDTFLNTARNAGPMFSGISVSAATSALNSNATVMGCQLKRFTLAVLLNEAAGFLRPTAKIDLTLVTGAVAVFGANTMTVADLITKIEAKYTGLDSKGNPTFNSWTRTQQEIVKNVAEAVTHFGHHDAQDIGILVG